MQNLINFLYRFRTLGFFLLLEVFCFWLIVSYNQRQNASFLNSSSFAIGNLNTFFYNTGKYLDLATANQQLLKENEQLRNELAKKIQLDSSHQLSTDKLFSFTGAQIINNTYRRSQNYLTINKGFRDKIAPGMGVISDKGIIGQVKSVSENFSTVTSLLHINLLVSSTVKRTNTLCTVQWDGLSPYQAKLKYIPRHIELQEGDTIVTSGYNAVFPPGQLIGTISSFELKKNDAFYDAVINLTSDFTSLYQGYVVIDRYKVEKDSLENQIERP